MNIDILLIRYSINLIIFPWQIGYQIERNPLYMCFFFLWHMVIRLFFSFAACSKIYHAKNIPLLDGVNTQMVEQNNSKLRKLKSQLSYMNHHNFMSHLKFFLWHCNKRVLDKRWCSGEIDCSGQECGIFSCTHLQTLFFSYLNFLCCFLYTRL